MNILQKTACTLSISVCTLTPVIMAQTANAAPATAQQATNNLVKQLSGIQSLSANFTQTTKLTSGKKQTNKPAPQHMNQTFTGTMKVARPGKFYWETLRPAKQTIVTTGKTVWIYDPDLQQAVKQSLDEQIANTPALLLSGNAQQIMQAYHISQPDAKKTYYSLTPKNREGAFNRLLISFGANNAPTTMILEDSMGQTTQVNFSNVKVNPTLNQSIFNFTPPKGTDIIEQ
ncbi:outer membrane lipoprotein chaperone LolA [Acinetobacter qingfengensis]|uniref:Outer-membrane lipoprotein carrier protein n=1 Tax=Acinetobacter qingfengensis TaxID=1262585 RepID=A0A1E7RF14_9GAMM|nr:outer membrane lipoprotein chaperone LolA [Acinetobacter qingfengensis]KAA8731887.1 outer membrane lipoprotein chaperone LolA [Acinetobacter qingfengensis]OEY97989.1 outer membrane lipoprotein carrier protein LolA [Acinetobacter qingfengensis]